MKYKTMSKWTPTLALRRSKCRIADAKAALLDDVREAFEDQIARDEEA